MNEFIQIGVSSIVVCSIFALGVAFGNVMEIGLRKRVKPRKTSNKSVQETTTQLNTDFEESRISRHADYDMRIQQAKEELMDSETSVNPPFFFDYDKSEVPVEEGMTATIITNDEEIEIERKAHM